jgi:isocitrate lyase
MPFLCSVNWRWTSTLNLNSRRISRRKLSSASVVQVNGLPLHPPSFDEEISQFKTRTADMAAFFSLPRFASLRRPYSPSSVASKQGSLPVLPLPSTLLADKLYAILSNAADQGRPVHTMGAIDPVQMTQMARHQEVVYVSGWAASSVLTTGNNEVGPDLGRVD